jgi:hypothetical protein
LCGIRTISQNFLALKPTFTFEVTTVQSDDSNLATAPSEGAESASVRQLEAELRSTRERHTRTDQGMATLIGWPIGR